MTGDKTCISKLKNSDSNLIVTIIKYYVLGYTAPSCDDIGEQNLFLALQQILYSNKCSNVHC